MCFAAAAVTLTLWAVNHVQARNIKTIVEQNCRFTNFQLIVNGVRVVKVKVVFVRLEYET